MSTEPKNKTLSLTIEGRDYIAPAPRMKILKQVLRFNVKHKNGEIDFDTPEGIDALFQLVIDLVGNPDLTIELLEEMEIGAFLEVFTLQSINDWIGQYFPQKKMMESQQVAKMKETQKNKSKQ